MGEIKNDFLFNFKASLSKERKETETEKWSREKEERGGGRREEGESQHKPSKALTKRQNQEGMRAPMDETIRWYAFHTCMPFTRVCLPHMYAYACLKETF